MNNQSKHESPLRPEQLAELQRRFAVMTGKEIWVALTMLSGTWSWALDVASAGVKDLAAELADPATPLAAVANVASALHPALTRMLTWRRWALDNHRCCIGAGLRN